MTRRGAQARLKSIGAAEEREGSEAMLCTMLICTCFVIPIIGALASARDAKVGFVGYALAVTVGLVVGLGCAWLMWASGEVVVKYLERPGRKYSESMREWCFRVLYLAALLWIVPTGIIGGWFSSVMLRFVLVH